MNYRIYLNCNETDLTEVYEVMKRLDFKHIPLKEQEWHCTSSNL